MSIGALFDIVHFMATTPPSNDAQLGSEKAVRFLLRRVGRPSELATSPLAAALCEVMGEAHPARALRALVNEALPGHTHAEARLRHIVLNMGFDDKLSAREAALEAHVSLRHMQRFRAEAVSAITLHLRRRMDAAQPAPEAAAAPRAARTRNWTTRFFSEVAAYDRAAERSDALEMATIAANMGRIASERERPFALRLQSEAALRLGQAAVATQRLQAAAAIARERDDTHELAMTSLLQAYKDAFHGNYVLAEETAKRALHACDALSRDWLLAELLVADTRITRRLSWQVPDAAKSISPASHAGTAFAIARARQAALGSRWEEALELASSAHTSAVGGEFDGLAARAAAVLAAAHRALGNEDESTVFRLGALARLLTTQDYLVASDLFFELQTAPITQVDDPPIDAVFDRLMLIVPQLCNDSPHQRQVVRSLLREVVARALDRFRPGRLLNAAAQRVRDVGSAFAQYALPANRAIEDTINVALIALAGRRFWSGQNVALKKALEASLEEFIRCEGLRLHRAP